ncbi:hypothetical protein BGV69_09120 [Burkholderia ubonensis]|nr:hypothetical protein BGV69_09120 [Burkholderia ubonensis]
MRGMDEMQEPLFTTVRLEDFVPADHPLRPLRLLVNQALKRLNGLFSTIYADRGRASIAPEKLLRALLLQVLYSVRSERMLMEQMRYNLLFRWFAGRLRLITSHTSNDPAEALKLAFKAALQAGGTLDRCQAFWRQELGVFWLSTREN